MAHYNWQGKGQGRIVRPGLEKVFEKAMADTELLDLQTDIAYHETMLLDISGEIAEGTAPWSLFKTIQKEWAGLWEATAREDGKDVQAHRSRLDVAIKSATDKIELFKQYLDVTDSKRKLVDTEAKRRKDMKLLVMVEDAIADYSALGVAVRRILTNEAELDTELALKLLGQIIDEFDRIVQGSAPLLASPA